MLIPPPSDYGLALDSVPMSEVFGGSPIKNDYETGNHMSYHESRRRAVAQWLSAVSPESVLFRCREVES